MLTEEALEILAEIPDRDTVSKYLAACEIRGDHTSRGCPVAVWLQKATGTDCSVNDGKVHFRSNGLKWTNALPPPVAEFAQMFDYGFYPQLELG